MRGARCVGWAVISGAVARGAWAPCCVRCGLPPDRIAYITIYIYRISAVHHRAPGRPGAGPTGVGPSKQHAAWTRPHEPCRLSGIACVRPPPSHMPPQRSTPPRHGHRTLAAHEVDLEDERPAPARSQCVFRLRFGLWLVARVYLRAAFLGIWCEASRSGIFSN